MPFFSLLRIAITGPLSVSPLDLLGNGVGASQQARAAVPSVVLHGMVLIVYDKQDTLFHRRIQEGIRKVRFGERIRQLRKEKGLGQRALAETVGVSFTYISKIENQKLDFGDYPSESLIQKLAEALDADEDELLLLAQKIPERIRQRVLDRPEAFREIAQLNDRALDRLLQQIGRPKRKARRK